MAVPSAGATTEDAFVQKLCDGTPLCGAAILEHNIPGLPAPKSSVAAKHNIDISERDAKQLLLRITKFKLQDDVLKVGRDKYLLAAISLISFHGRNMDGSGNGVIVVPRSRIVLLATYDATTLPQEALVYAERTVALLDKLRPPAFAQ